MECRLRQPTDVSLSFPSPLSKIYKHVLDEDFFNEGRDILFYKWSCFYQMTYTTHDCRNTDDVGTTGNPVPPLFLHFKFINTEELKQPIRIGSQ